MIANFVNLVLCLGVGWSAMCRLGAMHNRVKLQTATLYLALFVLSALSGLQFFLFGTLAGWVEVLASFLVAVILARTVRHWRTGPPAWCVRGSC